MQHMYEGPINCEENVNLHYYLDVKDRREDELDNLAYYVAGIRINIAHMFPPLIAILSALIQRKDAILLVFKLSVFLGII